MRATILVLNNKTAAMLIYQTNPVLVELFCSNKFAWLLATRVKSLYSHHVWFYMIIQIKHVMFVKQILTYSLLLV